MENEWINEWVNGEKTDRQKENKIEMMEGSSPKMAEEQDGETTFSPTNSSKDHLNIEQILQNNF